MKQTSLLLAILLLFSCFAYAELQNPGPARETLESGKVIVPERTRDIPEYTFITNPVELTTSYYDYMPGSYNSIPIRVQPTTGGIYIVYHSEEVSGAQRRVFYSYIDADGNVVNTSTISTSDIKEGYPGIAIDPETEDPMVSWHSDLDPSSTELECAFTYDLFHLMGGPGLWKTPFAVINSAAMTTPLPDDEFEWPTVNVGPSPVAGKRRVYVTANNGTAGPSGDPSENVMIAYADFDGNDLASQSELDWTYRTIDQLDAWHVEATTHRPFLAFTISETDGTIAYVGYDTEDRLTALVNTNYGEGPFELYQTDPLSLNTIDNPLNQDGTPYFDLEPGENLFMGPINSHHHSARFIDNDSRIVWNGAWGLQVDNADNSYYPWLQFPKVMSFDMATHEFNCIDVDLTGSNPNDNTPMIPWDLDADGQVDSFDDEGMVEMYSGFPYYYDVDDAVFHENNFKVTKNEEKNWVVALWQDGLKNKLAVAGDPNYVDWANVAELAIVISGDGGETWSDPLFLNNIDTPEFGGMMPAYFYPSDIIRDLGNNHGQLDLFFFDDNSFGSTIQGYGNDDGGTLMYCSIDLDFSIVNDAPNHTTAPVNVVLNQNYPNPFNPTTEISYNLTQAGAVTLEVFNSRGQKVKTLVSETQTAGTHTVEWNGTDDSSNAVSSGMYFYKMKTGTTEVAKKMILMK